MNDKAFVFVIGEDRPGIVSEVSRVLYENGCNIESSSMSLIENQFAIILIVNLEEADIQKIKAEYEKLSSKLALFIDIKQIPITGKKAISYNNKYIVSVYGRDKEGIVYKITSMLAGYNINIIGLSTKQIKSKEGYIYIMLIECDIPPKISIKEVQNRLRDISGQLDIDISIHPVEEAEL